MKLDIGAIAPLLRVFGDGQVLREWFAQLVLYSSVITLSGPYEDFFVLAQGVLRMLGDIQEVNIPASDMEELRTRILNMPAHPDVAHGLSLLNDAGFRLVTLTNSPPHPKGSPLEHAGMAHVFERQFSIDAIRQFKPAPTDYQVVASALDTPLSSLCMVAAHVWDAIGAQTVAYSGALITRSENAALLVGGVPQPNYIAPDLVEIAKQLIGFKDRAKAR